MNELRAVIFDLDGVLTDTAEYHYQAWQRLADDEGFPFDRGFNERLRGVGRRASLELILQGVERPEGDLDGLLTRKNGYYLELLERLGPGDLLPGAAGLLRDLRAAGIRTAVASASKNTATVLDRLGIAPMLDAVADGRTVERGKPAPDVFLAAARMLGVPAGLCVAVEDAAVGVDAALAAGMWAVGLGPAERVGHAHVRLDDLAGLSWERLRAEIETAAWTVAEPAFDAAGLRHRETVFTLGNGNLCVRGSFEEGHPGQHPAAFLHRVWDDMPVSVTELANLPRFLGIDLWLDGERVRLDRGTVLAFDRRLDLRTGVLVRTVRWSAGGCVLDLTFERFVPATEPNAALGRVTATLLTGNAELRLRAGLDAHVDNTGLVHFDVERSGTTNDAAWLGVITRGTGTRVALAREVRLDGPPSTRRSVDADTAPAIEYLVRLVAGDRVRLTTVAAIVPDLTAVDPAGAAAALARRLSTAGWEAVRAASDADWARRWEGCDVVVDGDPEAQVALRYHLFQLLIAAPRFTDHASIGAKTLSGFGYRHHVFWDTETFMLPLFTFTEPQVARNMLAYRWHGLAGARRKAAANGFAGAQFPWESAASGDEVTPTWVTHHADRSKLVRIWTGDIEIHITADIALAVRQYVTATGDLDFLRDLGAELVLDGASFFATAARLETDGHYHYRDVIGPDEYHEHVDDNAYTNHLAVWHLRYAAEVLAWLRSEHPDSADRLTRRLGIDAAREALWADVAARLHRPRDPETGLVEQFAGYFGLTDVDQVLARDPCRTISMQQLYGIEETNLTQNLKQPDVLMLAYLLPDLFTPAELAANYAYYDPRTDHEHGSSLGPAISAVMACRAGDPQTGYAHFRRAARADLLDVRHNASDGIHGASAGGLWQATVFGFAGLRVSPDGYTTDPHLPRSWERLTFTVSLRGERHRISVTASSP